MKKGFALITVLAVLIIIALGTATLLQAITSFTNMKANNLQEVKAQYLAEAGMQYALWKCRTAGCTSNTTLDNGIAKQTLDIDGIPVVIKYPELAPTGSNQYEIQIAVDYENL